MRVDAIDASRLPDFIGLPFRLHGGDPLWVPPMRQQVAHELSAASAFARHGRLQPFLAVDGGDVVGRVAALLTPKLCDGDGKPIGQVGYFECVDSEALSGLLLQAAAEWLDTQGAAQIVGPMNGGAHRAHRLMTSGFDLPPFLLEPRNPPYYVRLFEAAGFARLRSWASYELPRARLSALLEERGLARVVQRARRRYRVDILDARNQGATLARLHPLLDASFAGHAGYASLDLAELSETFGGLLALLSDRHVGVAVGPDGRDAGFAFMYPDDSEEARALRGDASGWGRWAASRRLRRVVLHTLAFRPEARGRGAPLLCLAEGLRLCAEDGVDEIVVALVDEAFGLFARLAPAARTYALYARALR